MVYNSRVKIDKYIEKYKSQPHIFSKKYTYICTLILKFDYATICTPTRS